jgi:hypothetical protein
MATGRVPTTANSPLTAKGDLFTYSTAPARLAVGNNGDTIVADSSTSTGLRYQEPKAANPVLNSAMQIAQRGTSFSIAASTMVDTLDRWRTYIPNTGCTFSQQLTGDTTNLPNIQYCLRVARNSGQTVTGLMQLAQNFETVNSIPFVGKTVTMSFYARRGANFSSASNLLNVYLYSGTGTDQNLLQNYTGAATPINSTATLTTTWQRFSFTGTISASATEIAPYFTYTPSGTAGAADYYEITGVQLEVGSVATPFKTYAGTIQGELDACERYCETITPADGGGIPYAAANGTNAQGSTISFHTKKRVAASVTRTAGTVEWWTGGGWTAVSPTLAGGVDNMAWAIDTGTSSTNRLIRHNGTTYLATAEL